MDPTQQQEDKKNNISALSENSPVDENVTDATGGTGTAAATPAPVKKSPIKKFWDKFNIYLVLFVLVVVLAIGIVVVLTAKSKQTAQQAIGSEGLSQDALKQLASTDVTVGNPKQILTVQANAVFAGAVLIRSNLEVAGTLKIGGSLSLGDLTVTGTSKLGDAEVNNLNVNGPVTLNNILTLKGGMNVTGRSSFSGELLASSLTTGTLTLNGDLRLTHHITAGGTIPNIDRGAAVGGGGTVSLSGSDTSGSIAINTGTSPPAGCLATITFSEKFSNTPHVIISPVGSSAAGLTYYVTRTTSSFVICTTTPAPAGDTFGFDYIALN